MHVKLHDLLHERYLEFGTLDLSIPSFQLHWLQFTVHLAVLLEW